MKLPRRKFLHLAAGAAALPAVSRFAWAQAYPSRPVRMIVGFTARQCARHRRAPDGSMALGTARPTVHCRKPTWCWRQHRHRSGRAVTRGWLYAPPGRPPNAINATLYDKLSFNFLRDIAPVAGITRERLVMVVHPSFPAKTVPEFIAYAKANPGKISMASPGNGTSPHVAGELFKMMAGIDMIHVPYRGGARYDRLDRRTGAGQFHWAGLWRSSTSGPASCVRSRSPRRAARTCYRTSRPWAISCRATRQALLGRWRTSEHACRHHRHAQQGN